MTRTVSHFCAPGGRMRTPGTLRWVTFLWDKPSHEAQLACALMPSEWRVAAGLEP